MGYHCLRCKRSLELDKQHEGVRCPFCGSRIWVKDQPLSVRKIGAV